MHQQEMVRADVNDRVGQTWNFPVRCKDGIHLVTGTVVETIAAWMDHENPGDYHRILILESSSSSKEREPDVIMTLREVDLSRWDSMSSWTRLG